MLTVRSAHHLDLAMAPPEPGQFGEYGVKLPMHEREARAHLQDRSRIHQVLGRDAFVDVRFEFGAGALAQLLDEADDRAADHRHVRD